ncbi:hypothetical protein TVNIR_3525 [Thioalkalivibrio nitratireducens DSM 14787]|uniref:Uncharacterized protein n=1 Tax=Thioalkalivibrio nitratireducens (strain DSM 14787 / UNIQEM 213 / ALEN2) TaxID=1255043 RepID=L0E1I3_THIND|nr:hypothetical protein TVNIR_3525 [Thioalkalivibrio nitratireducens DSM 14787]
MLLEQPRKPGLFVCTVDPGVLQRHPEKRPGRLLLGDELHSVFGIRARSGDVTRFVCLKRGAQRIRNLIGHRWGTRHEQNNEA